MRPIHTEVVDSFTIKIYPDEDAENPFKEMDLLGTIYHYHSRYVLGTYKTLDELKEMEQSKDYISLPLYLLDHSGLRVSTSDFNDQWDSGQVGIIAVHIDKALKEFGRQFRKKAVACLKSEVEIFDQYLSGQIYGYVITDKNGNDIDNGSCWGHYGLEYCLKCAKEALPDETHYYLEEKAS